MRTILLIPMLVATLVAAAPDLESLPFQAIRDAWLRDRTTLDSDRARAYREMLESRRTAADIEYQDKIAARNVKGMSIARKTRDLCDACLASVQTNGTFTVPASVRRELVDWIKRLDEDKTAIDARTETGINALRAKYKAQLAETLARQTGEPAPTGAALDALFDRLLATAPAKPAAPIPASVTNTPPEKLAPLSPWFASSGEGSNWFTAGRWTADMMGQDIFSIPILNVTSSYAAVKPHPLSGESSRFTYEVVHPVPADAATRYTFRLKRLPDRKPVALLAWPSPENRGRLEFRTQPAAELPSPHGFEIEAAAVVQTRTGPQSVEARIESEPAGAEIRLSGKRLVGADGNASRTPARLRLPPGSRTVTLVLENHVSKTFEKWDPLTEPRLFWKFQHETDLPPAKILKLDPARAWTPADVQVRVGDRLWIVPAGQWAVGRKSEICGAEGYPESDRFAHYYGAGEAGDPRQKTDAPYGALLMRIGRSSDPVAVTRTRCLPVPETGGLFFDVNEKPDKEFRKDNRGQMTVKLIVIPFNP